MIAPLFKLGIVDQAGMIVIAILVGITFGYILQAVGMGNSRKISAMFYGNDWAVMRIMFSAVVTAMVLTYLAFYLGFLDISLVQLTGLNLTGQIVGGLLLGAGMVVGGY
ncbi:MAG: YeeE/YedE family protein [Proteobacteria bacterium]|nr:YeeE/YedE family protein [Pseudomonadota bacterium]